AAVFQNLDPERYEPVAIRIEKDGRWTLPSRPPLIAKAADVIHSTARLPDHAREAHFIAHPGGDTLLTVDGRDDHAVVSALALDVIFPVLHGPYGEDGTVQGLLELANVPYVGAGVLASAVGMDKAIAKLVFAARGLPVAPYTVVLRQQWLDNQDTTEHQISSTLGFPLFVKPANLGSSVGISKAKNPAELKAGLKTASEFDRKIVIEAAVPSARELECAVLGNDCPEASAPGEVIPSREFYDYQAKYLDDDSQIVIPAEITETQAAEIRRLAIEVFRAVDAAGMARV